MARWTAEDELPHDDWDANDEGSDADWNNDEENENDTETCSHCGADKFADSPQCPACGNYPSEEESTRVFKPWWIILGIVLSLIVMYLLVMNAVPERR